MKKPGNIRYTKNYRDKERLYGFAVWLEGAELKPTAKNIAGLMLCQERVNDAIAEMARASRKVKR